MTHENGSLIEEESIRNEKKITDPTVIPILFHQKKQVLLKILIEREMNIIDLKNKTRMNPGTIKRHLTDLLEKDLIRQVRMEKNIYGVKMKFYRAVAKQYIVSIRWPT